MAAACSRHRSLKTPSMRASGQLLLGLFGQFFGRRLAVDRVLKTAAEAHGALDALRLQRSAEPLVTLTDVPNRTVRHGERGLSLKSRVSSSTLSSYCAWAVHKPVSQLATNCRPGVPFSSTVGCAAHWQTAHPAFAAVSALWMALT